VEGPSSCLITVRGWGKERKGGRERGREWERDGYASWDLGWGREGGRRGGRDGGRCGRTVNCVGTSGRLDVFIGKRRYTERRRAGRQRR